MFCKGLPPSLSRRLRSARHSDRWELILRGDAEFQILLSEFRYRQISGQCSRALTKDSDERERTGAEI